jgi:hypothetical protein
VANDPTTPTPTIAAHRTPTQRAGEAVVSLLILGTPGDGKTCLAADFTPEGSNAAVAFEERLLPVLEARRAHEIAGSDVGTVVIDSGTELFESLSHHIIGTNTAQRNSQPKFGEFKIKGHEILRRVAGLAKPKGNSPRYNVAVTFHLRDVTDADGNISKSMPAIFGALKGEAPKHFDCTLLFRRRIETQVSTTPGTPSRKITHYEAWSVPPENIYRDTGLLDRMGGPSLVEDPSFAKLVSLWKEGA